MEALQNGNSLSCIWCEIESVFKSILLNNNNDLSTLNSFLWAAFLVEFEGHFDNFFGSKKDLSTRV